MKKFVLVLLALLTFAATSNSQVLGGPQPRRIVADTVVVLYGVRFIPWDEDSGSYGMAWFRNDTLKVRLPISGRIVNIPLTGGVMTGPQIADSLQMTDLFTQMEWQLLAGVKIGTAGGQTAGVKFYNGTTPYYGILRSLNQSKDHIFNLPDITTDSATVAVYDPSNLSDAQVFYWDGVKWGALLTTEFTSPIGTAVYSDNPALSATQSGNGLVFLGRSGTDTVIAIYPSGLVRVGSVEVQDSILFNGRKAFITAHSIDENTEQLEYGSSAANTIHNFTGVVAVNGIPIVYDSTSNSISNLTSTVIDWSTYSQFKDTLAISSITYTFSNVVVGKTIKVSLVTDASRLNVALWPATVYWPTGTTNPTASMYASSVYELEFKANASDFIAGRLVDYRDVVDTTTIEPDTLTPDAPSIVLYANNPGKTDVVWPPVLNTPVSGFDVRFSANTPIAETSSTDTTGTNYPTVSVQNIILSGWSGSASYMDVPLSPAVTPGITFVTRPSYEASNNSRTRANNIMAVLSDDGTYVRLKKMTASYATSISNINFSTFSFNKWVSVRHNDSLFASGITQVTMPLGATVDLAHTFPIPQQALPGELTEANDFGECTYPSTSSVQMQFSGSQGNNAEVYVQSVTSESLDVQTIPLSLGSTTADTVVTGALSPTVTVARSFSILTYRGGSGTTINAGKMNLQGFIASSSSYSATRDTAGPSITGTAYVVTAKAGWPIVTTQQSYAFAAADTQETAATTSAPLTRSMIHGTGYIGRMGIGRMAGFDSIEALNLSIRLTDSITTRVDRWGGGIARARTEVVTFPVGAAGGITDSMAFDSLTATAGSFTVLDGGNIRYSTDQLAPSTVYYGAAKTIGQNNKKSALSNVINFVTPAQSTGVNNGDLFVDFDDGSDTNPGTVGSPLKTLGAAIAIANSGDTIRVADTTEVTTTFTKFFDPPVIIKAYIGQRVLFDFASSTSATALYFASGSGGYIFDSIGVQGGAHWAYAPSGGNPTSRNVTFKYCSFYNFWGWAGIEGHDVESWTVDHCWVDANGDTTGKFEVGGYDGIYFSGARSRKNLVQYSTVIRAQHSGIAFEYRCRESRMRHNTAYWNKINFSNNTNSARNVIEYNTGWQNGLFGMHSGHGGDGLHWQSDSSIARFNVVYRDTIIVTEHNGAKTDPYINGCYAGTQIAGGTPYNVRVSRFYNNTFVNDTRGPALWWGAAQQLARWDSTAQFRDFKGRNNIYAGYDSVVWRWQDSYVSTSLGMAQVELKANLFTRWPVGGATGKKLISVNSNRWTLATAKINYPNTFDASNIDGNPLFSDTSANDFGLGIGSPAAGTGTYLTTTSTAGTNSTQMKVVDPNWISDGLEGGVEGDRIRCASWGEAVRVIARVGTVLTLEKVMTWTSGEAVYFNADLTPNIGAY